MQGGQPKTLACGYRRIWSRACDGRGGKGCPTADDGAPCPPGLQEILPGGHVEHPAGVRPRGLGLGNNGLRGRWLGAQPRAPPFGPRPFVTKMFGQLWVRAIFLALHVEKNVKNGQKAASGREPTGSHKTQGDHMTGGGGDPEALSPSQGSKLKNPWRVSSKNAPQSK